jgi:hypothetical protein
MWCLSKRQESGWTTFDKLPNLRIRRNGVSVFISLGKQSCSLHFPIPLKNQYRRDKSAFYNKAKHWAISTVGI